MNYFKTAVLLAGMTGLLMVVGFLIGGQSGA
jgi:heat shock protein HtpX